MDIDTFMAGGDGAMLTYTEHLYRHTTPLPPPARVILLYAVLGWSREQGGDYLPGWRPLPLRKIWWPVFDGMMAEPDWLGRFCDYALEGLRYERSPPALLMTVERAFVWPGFDEMLMDAMADQKPR